MFFENGAHRISSKLGDMKGFESPCEILTLFRLLFLKELQCVFPLVLICLSATYSKPKTLF